MAKIDDVMLAVTHCLRSNDCSHCEACPYNDGADYGCRARLRDDIIVLLKEQKPVKPYGMYSEHTGTKWLTCGACDQPMIKMTPDAVYPNYCPECGRKVLWE